MSLINGVWNNLKFYAGGVAGAKLSWNDLKFYAGDVAGAKLLELNMRIRKNKNAGDVTYKYQRGYKNVLVFAAKRYAVQKLERELKSLLPKALKKIDKQAIDFVRKQQEARYVSLIKQRALSDTLAGYGTIKTKEGNTITAKDKYGTGVSGALIVSFDGEDSYTVQDGNGKFNTVTRFIIDLSPEISMNSNKNVVLTQVTGRDYTRKELVSGGDLEFSVNGTLVSDEPGVYPQSKVNQFMEIMQYNGIVNVNSHFFGNLNVKQIIIKDFNLARQEYMNVQPYSFSCVAVEPDEEIKVVRDTIQQINNDLALSPVNKWFKLTLTNKLAKIVSAATVSGVSAGLDALTEFNEPD